MEEKPRLELEQTSGGEQEHRSLASRITHLPPAVGVVLAGIGAAGLVIPGPFGTPFLVAGGLVLAPRLFGSVDRFFQRRFPQAYGAGMQVVERFVSDMEKRFPPPKSDDDSASG